MASIAAQALSRAATFPQRQFGNTGGGRRNANQFKPTQDPDYKYFGIPDSPEGLQYTDQLMKSSMDIYSRRQNLINFAKSAWKNQGIDVTNPDPSRRDAIIAAEIFNAEVGNLMGEIDKSKQGQELYKTAFPKYLSGEVAPGAQVGQQYMSQLTPQQAGMFTGTTEPLNVAATELSTEFGTPGQVKEAQQRVQREIQRYQALEQSDPTNAAFWKSQREQAQNLLMPRQQVWAPRKDDGDGGENDPHYGYLRKYAYLSTGSPAMYRQSGQFKEDTGSEYGISYEDANSKLGNYTYKDKSGKPVTKDFIVSHYLFDPDTKEAYAVATDPEAPKKKLDPQLLLSFAGEIADSNSKGFISGASLRKFAEQNAKKNKFDDFSANDFLSNNDLGHADNFASNQRARGIPKQEERAAQEEELATNRKDRFVGGKLNPANWVTTNTAGTFTTPEGKEFTVVENVTDDKLYIPTYSSVLPRPDANGDYNLGGVKIPKSAVKDGMTPKQVRQILEYLKATKAGTESTPKKSVEIDPDI
jgi:hypothetical protein